MKKILIALVVAIGILAVTAGCNNQTVEKNHEQSKPLKSESQTVSEDNGGLNENKNDTSTNKDKNNNSTKDNVNSNKPDTTITQSDKMQNNKNENSKPQSNQNTQNKDKLITKDEAKNIALKDAGVKAADVYGFEIEFDREKRYTKYEIEFNVGKTEYSYDIDAANGTILEREIDRD